MLHALILRPQHRPLFLSALLFVLSSLAQAEITLSLPSRPPHVEVEAYNSGPGYARVELQPFAGGPSQPVRAVLAPETRQVLSQIQLKSGSALSLSALNWQALPGDFNAQPDPAAQYLRPLDREPEEHKGGYRFETLSEVPVRTARDGILVELKASVQGNWFALVEHADHTLGRYGPLDFPSDIPELGHKLRAGGVIGRTARSYFDFTLLLANQNFSEPDAAYTPQPVTWSGPPPAADGPASDEPASQLGDRASVATGQVATPGSQGTAPPQAANAVAGGAGASASQNQEVRWGQFFSIIGGLAAAAAALTFGVNLYNRRSHSKPEHISGGHFEHSDFGKRTPPVKPHSGNATAAKVDPYKQLLRRARGDEAKVEKMIEQEMRFGLNRQQAILKALEKAS